MSNPHVLGFIVRSGIFPAFATVIIQHGDDIVAVYARGERQIIDIASASELSIQSKHFIEYKTEGGREEFNSSKLAFAVSGSEVLFLSPNDLRDELLALAKYSTDSKLAEAYADAADDLLRIS